jgi:hypothetical protein
MYAVTSTMINRTLLSTATLFAILAAGTVAGIAQDHDGDDSNTSTTVTNVSGTIAQLNYGNEGTIEGFLIGTNVLLSFPANVAGGIGTLGVVGNSVTYSGTAVTNSSGFQSVRVTSFTNNTTKATYTTTTATSTAYGPTSGTVKQLNYDPSGSIDGFLFTPSGSTTAVFVATGSRASATLKPLLTVGAAISVTGTTAVNLTPVCVAAGTLLAVDATSLTVGGQTILITGGGGDGGRGHR